MPFASIQADIEERNAQIALMRRIYRDASTVLIWLGNDIKHSSLALKCMKDVVQIWRRTGHSDVGRLLGVVQPFFNHPWFTRAWALQEALLAERAIFHSGSQALNFQDFIAFYLNSSLKLGHDTRSLATNVSELCKVQKRYKKGTLGLFGLLLRTRCRKAADPWDNIFSLLGLLHNTGALWSLQPDYSISMPSLWASVARYCIEVEGDMSVLSAAGLRFQAMTDLLPWVINWNIFSDIGHLLVRRPKHRKTSSNYYDLRRETFNSKIRVGPKSADTLLQLPGLVIGVLETTQRMENSQETDHVLDAFWQAAYIPTTSFSRHLHSVGLAMD